MLGFWLMAFMMLMGTSKWSHKAVFWGARRALGLLREGRSREALVHCAWNGLSGEGRFLFCS